MKVAPVSADLLIKIGLGVVLLGAAYFALNKTASTIGAQFDQLRKNISDTVDSVTGAPGRVVDWAATEADTRGAAIQAGNAPQSPELQDLTGRTYSNPLMTNDGMDFSQLSG